MVCISSKSVYLCPRFSKFSKGLPTSFGVTMKIMQTGVLPGGWKGNINEHAVDKQV